MSLAKSVTGYLSREDYYRWCDEQPTGRYERHEGRIVAMAPERGAHLRMKAEVLVALRRAVKDAGIPCQALPDGAAVMTGESDYEPDALVNCGEPMADDALAAPNPVVVVEVLSPGTRSIDTGAKLAAYFRVPSIHHCLIVHPTKPSVIHHRRVRDAPGNAPGDAIATRLVASGFIAMTPPRVVLHMGELYGAAQA